VLVPGWAEIWTADVSPLVSGSAGAWTCSCRRGRLPDPLPKFFLNLVACQLMRYPVWQLPSLYMDFRLLTVFGGWWRCSSAGGGLYIPNSRILEALPMPLDLCYECGPSRSGQNPPEREPTLEGGCQPDRTRQSTTANPNRNGFQIITSCLSARVVDRQRSVNADNQNHEKENS
jgi:hypothetical protein